MILTIFSKEKLIGKIYIEVIENKNNHFDKLLFILSKHIVFVNIIIIFFLFKKFFEIFENIVLERNCFIKNKIKKKIV